MTNGYRRVQIGWTSLVVTALLGGVVLWQLRRLPAAQAFAAAVFACVLGMVATLTIDVGDDGIAWWFTGGVFRRRVRFDELRAIRAGRVPPISFGLHTNLRGTWLYNVSGTRVVELDLENGERLLIGCDDPDAVVAAIRRHVILA